MKQTTLRADIFFSACKVKQISQRDLRSYFHYISDKYTRVFSEKIFLGFTPNSRFCYVFMEHVLISSTLHDV